MQLSVDIRDEHRLAVLRLRGAFVSPRGAATVREGGKTLLAEQKNLLLTLTHVTEIDSGGLGALVELLLSARKGGGDLKLASVPERVQHSLEITRLASIFEIFPGEEGALASFPKQS